jgi:predicted glycogen debranching enzyme
LAPPLHRHVLLSRIDEEVVIGDRAWRVTSTEFEDALVNPSIGVAVTEFTLNAGHPTWAINVEGRGSLERQVWMEDGRTATYVRYAWTGQEACTIVLRPLATSRDFHHEWRGDANWAFEIQRIDHADVGGLQVRAQSHSPTWQLLVDAPTGTHWHWDFDQARWWWNFRHREEHARGFDSIEDLYCLGAISVALKQGEAVLIGASLAVDGQVTAARLATGRRATAQQTVAAEVAEATVTKQSASPLLDPVASALRDAAASFLVRREELVSDGNDASMAGWTVLAGYHWFGDWGRDTFIALPGLARLTGRHDLAREVLRSWSRAVNLGMVPNRFPDTGAPLGEGDFNTVDGTLWFVRAIGEIDRLGNAPRGTELSKELWPVIATIIDAHLTGTRHGIGVDPKDGLLRVSDGQLTWMDARVDGQDQTPRAGKPVEVNALWIHALDRAVTWARATGDVASATRYGTALDHAVRSFSTRFWWPGTTSAAHGISGTGGYLYDCIDGPNGSDASLRPNQVIAASLATTPLTGAQRTAVLDVAKTHLLTPRGLRSLSPEDPRYRGECVGNAAARDSAYHQGTVWAWLLGPMVDALILAGTDVATAHAVVEPMRAHIWREACVGTISEIFDGTAPFHARGAVSQAWSVAEVGRAWLITSLKP